MEQHTYQGNGGDCEVKGCGQPVRAGIHLTEISTYQGARVLITKMPTGEFNVNAEGVTPVELIGIGEVVKGMGLGMIGAGQVGNNGKRGRN